ncbi:MAG: hypothetical protein E7345_02310 [Clostridiales bacterium]|nr:hypothetical protein [Clostridiales bacterium]
MLITEEERVKIVEFLSAVDEMIEGRFILSDTKVANILKGIVKSEVLYNLYSKCMQGFKFMSMMDRCKAENPSNGGYFVMPDEEKDIIAFVTCLLLEVDKKNINLQTFVTDNFYSNDGYNISYNNFALTVLVTYKTSIKNLLGIDDEGKIIEDEDFSDGQIAIEEEKVEADQDTKILFANLVMNINELYNAINDDYKIKMAEKEELLIVLKALNRAVHLEELLVINALLIPLEHSLNKYKKLRPIYENVKLLIADIYY